MKVTKLEAARYLVASETEEHAAWMVDLLAFEGNGECACPDFQIRMAPALRDGARPLRSMCKHILAARNAFTNDALARMLELMKTAQ